MEIHTTAVILYTIWKSAVPIFIRLLDGIDPAITAQTKNVVSEIKVVIEIRGILAHWLGHMLSIEATICVDSSLTVAYDHTKAEEVHHELHELSGTC